MRIYGVIKIVNLLVLGMALCLFTACQHAPMALKPASWVFKQVPEDAPPNFKKGWIDGCNSGAALMTNNMYRTFYQFQQDKNLMSNPEYYKAWVDANAFCRHYFYGLLREGDVRHANAGSQYGAMTNTFMGTDNFLEYGALNLLGPGKQGLMLENWGVTGGDGFFDEGGVMDFTADSAWNGTVGGWGTGGVMDFTPAHSISPY